MEETPQYFVQIEAKLIDLLNRVVKRPRTTLLEPPVPLDLVQPELDNFKGHSSFHIEQAARSCVYRISVCRGIHDSNCRMQSVGV